jgi:predicted mannosyl-3-phosphoglycerate phosphatase (HAD superfamily)
MAKALEIHRSKPLCASCHDRFDPLGLALENYNALGLWRDTDRDEPIQTGGQLMTGERFTDAKNLGKVLATERKVDFYRCLTEKLLTYALGRGMEYYDTPTIDRIVERLERDGGKMRSLIYGVVASAPFQKRRGDGDRLK